jgi:hypothetical protein
MAIVAFFVGSISIYALVMWIHIRELKAGVKNWSPNKGLTFILGIGRDKLFFPSLNPQERTELKARLAAPGEIVSDEDVDLFLRLCGRSLFWFLVAELSFVAVMMAVIATIASPSSRH